jgi:hypothetical protein
MALVTVLFAMVALLYADSVTVLFAMSALLNDVCYGFNRYGGVALSLPLLFYSL